MTITISALSVVATPVLVGVVVIVLVGKAANGTYLFCCDFCCGKVQK
ncbi:hypothetical protein ATG66_1046 [Vibrio sp. ES.051]|nr:hypothetical protein [Vibrio sp. ES.051]PFG58496.1 hypothetical protein ATG66_1046 [Vibrio sp. ES.051]